MSWHFSQGPEGEFSVDAYLAGLRSARWKLNATRENVSCSGSGTDSCRTSPSGMTSALLMGDLGGGLSMSLAEVSHVRTSARREREQGLMELAAGSGLRCAESFAKYDRDSRSWRTLQCSLLADLDVYSETWPRQGIMLRGWCWELETSVLRTKGTEFGFSQRMPNGSTFFPTPTCEDSKCKTNPAQGRRRSPGLAFVVSRMLPTPLANDAKNNGGPGQQARKSPQLGAVVGGALNPPWVEWLMGWPVGWTDLKPLEMDKFLSWLQLHSASLKKLLNLN